jgi:hypothetical protein
MFVWGFKYQKRSDVSDALSREDVKYDRNKFLVQYRRLIAEGYTPVFGDETWVNSNHTRSHLWQVFFYFNLDIFLAFCHSFFILHSEDNISKNYQLYRNVFLFLRMRPPYYRYIFILPCFSTLCLIRRED